MKKAKKLVKLGTQISPQVFASLREASQAEGIKIRHIVEEGIKLWIAANRRKNEEGSATFRLASELMQEKTTVED